MTKAPPVDEAWLARNLGIAPADPIEAAAAKRSGAPTATEERARKVLPGRRSSPLPRLATPCPSSSTSHGRPALRPPQARLRPG
jgi:hypothetical protein